MTKRQQEWATFFCQWLSRDGAVVRALASHQCGPGSIPGLGVICGLSLLLVLVPAPRVFLRVLRFFSLHKNQHFQIPIRPGNSGEKSHPVDSTEIPIYLFIYFIYLFILFYLFYFTLLVELASSKLDGGLVPSLYSYISCVFFY